LLRPFFKSDGEGEEESYGEYDPLRGSIAKRAEQSRVEEEGENAVEDEVSDLVTIRKFIDESKRVEMTRVGKDDDGEDQERKKYSDRFQSKFSF